MYDETPLGIAVFDSRTGQFHSVNAMFAKFIGRDVDAMSRFNWMCITHPDDLQEELRNIALLNAGKISSFQMEKRYRHRDGSFVWGSITVAPVHAEDKAHPRHLCMVEDITVRKLAEDETLDPEFYDALTHLPNQRLLLDRLRSAISASASNKNYGAVLFIDLDDFAVLNDTLGCDQGDLLLIETARRIQSCVTEMDTVARLQGDEFAILLREIDGHAEHATRKTRQLADTIRAALATPYLVNEQNVNSTPSIGIALFKGYELSPDELLKQAETAMYQAKGEGRNTACVFDPASRSADTPPLLEAYLRRAVPNQQLHLHYQIQVDHNNRPLGAEALVRWTHPTHGIIAAAQFIPIAEQSSLIFTIGDWVLKTACQQLAVWAKNESTRSLTLTVNVSARQFRQPDFVGKLARLLRDHNVDASRLKIELTEGLMLGEVTNVVARMQALKNLGISLSLDDFGTGQTSLSYLERLPFDQIKIDQDFVRDIISNPNEAVMVQAIIDITKSLRMNVIAEGVETEAQQSYLAKHGCSAYQGYFFGKPMPIEQFETLLSTH